MKRGKVLLLEIEKRNPMQSGEAREGKLFGTIREESFSENSDLFVEPIMGWIGSNNTMKQIRFEFDCLNDAEIYAEKNDMQLILKKDRTYIAPMKRKSYSDNFK